MLEDHSSQKDKLLFIGSDCLNRGQQLQGRKVIKGLQNGPLIDFQKLWENDNITKNFTVDIWIPQQNINIQKQILDLQKKIFEGARSVKGKAFYIFYSGISYRNGDWVISQKDSSELRRIPLSYIIQEWQKLKSSGVIRQDLKLVIFMDSSYSGMWCWRLITLIKILKQNKKDICIFASTIALEQTHDNYGGLFFNCLFSKNQTQFKSNYKNLRKQNQEPIYMGPQLEFPIILSEDEIDSIRKDLSNSINIGFIKKIFKKPFPQDLSEKNTISNKDCIYVGDMCIDSQDVHKHGFGQLVFIRGENFGTTYLGYWKKGQYHGRGVLTYPNGTKYEGNFKQNKYSGFGKLTIGDQQYEGMFLNSRKHGEGVLKYKNGDIYFGNFKEDKMQGYGIFKYSNGDRYEGNWKNNLRDGIGLHIKKDGTFYEGQWSKDFKHGDGFLYLVRKQKTFKGKFLDDEMYGEFVVEEYKGQRIISRKIIMYKNGKVINDNVIEEQADQQIISQ